MTWTNTKPTKAGWYWMQHASSAKREANIEMVFVNGAVGLAPDEMYVLGCGWIDEEFLVKNFHEDTKWHGPVDEPQFMESGKVWWTDRAADRNT